jgi:hypothetical protein
MSKIRWKKIGEGDDFISEDDWSQPISDYPNLLQIVNICESEEQSFPDVELTKHLKSFDIYAEIRSLPVCTEDLLEDILGENFCVSSESWGGESPGQSGFYRTAKIRIGRFREIRRRLAAAEKFITVWSNNVELKINSTSQSVRPQLKAKIKSSSNPPQSTGTSQEIKQQKWQKEIVEKIIEAIRDKKVYCRLNFLVYDGIVFFLDTSWWHSTGDTQGVADVLIGQGLPLIKCNVIETQRGWIPHFSRRKEEEDGLGWNEPTLKVEVSDKNFDATKLAKAMQAHKLLTKK